MSAAFCLRSNWLIATMTRDHFQVLIGMIVSRTFK
jgi:hypothetical protein